ncbi:MAG: phage tail protein [Tumebacillaceae bacterium]
MADAFIGEIRIFAGNFPPQGWAFCNGQLLPISQNTALFSILGTQYGGNGTTNFALPNLAGSAAMSQGNGPGLTPRVPGETVGAQAVTLESTNMPAHTHGVNAVAAVGTSSAPTANYWAEGPFGSRHSAQPPLYDPTANTTMSPNALTPTGGNQPHNNMQPYLSLSFIICMSGIFPPRG